MKEQTSGFDRHGRDRPAGLPRRGFRRRELVLPDGGRLILRPDGTIDQLAADGTPAGTWPMNAEGWADRAFRFGIRTGERTPPHSNRDIEDSKPG